MQFRARWSLAAIFGCLSMVEAGLVAYYYLKYKQSRRERAKVKPDIRDGVEGLIGNTPLVRIKSLSEQTGCDILAKAELLEPGGSTKDRVALAIIQDAEQRHLLKPGRGDVIFEGTSGSTGISLAMLAKAKGYSAHICLPDDTSDEKVSLLKSLGAVVEKVRPASIVDKRQYVNRAREAARELSESSDPQDKDKRGLFADQFENEANWQCHYSHTGPEIWRQTGHRVDAFVSGSGTGGTISGVGQYLKEKNPKVKIILADPPGSGLHRKVKYGVLFDSKEKEGTRRRHQVDTLVEGIGLNRLTANFEHGLGCIDDSFRVSDKEAQDMAKKVVENDGLFVGSSTAVNLVAAVKYAETLGPGHVIVTLLCDSGTRHLSKFWKGIV